MTQQIGGGLAIGAGVGISSVALAPFNAANTFLGSAFFGYGMILGERYMYQADWPKIQQRLENGEKIENIIQEYTGVFTATVMKEAKIIFDTVTREFIEIMKQALLSGQVGETKIEAGSGGSTGGGRAGRGGGAPSAGTVNKPPPPTITTPTVPTFGSVQKIEFERLRKLMDTQFGRVMLIDKWWEANKTKLASSVKNTAYNNLFNEYKKFVELQKAVIAYAAKFNINWPEKSYIPIF